MAELHEIMEIIEAFEKDIVLLCAEKEQEKRIEMGRDFVGSLDILRQYVQGYAVEVAVRTRPQVETGHTAAAVDYSAIRMAQEKAYHDRIDHNKITSFLHNVKGSPLPDSLIFFLRESGYFDKDGDRDEADADSEN